jgi:ABC transporter DrrB family efflux protein
MFLVTSITTLRERRSGTLERLLMLPLGKGDFIGGYAIAFGLLAALQAAAAVAWAVWVCGLEVEGSVWLLVLVAVLNGLLGTMLGLLASAFATTEFQVVQFMPVFVAPQILLGGIFLARDQMPDALQAISDWLPLSYAIDALNLVKTGGETSDVLLDALVVAAFALGALVLAALTLRRKTA